MTSPADRRQPNAEFSEIAPSHASRVRHKPPRAVIPFSPPLTDRDVLSAREPKASVDPWRPITSFVEPERQADGQVHDVATIFLANRECPFRCLYCDLWRHTLDEPTPRGAVPTQIDIALKELGTGPSIVKLYNSGNFFDAAAIPPEDWPAIADRVRHFQRVIVENHPLLIDDRCLRFRDLSDTRLEVAMGLETAHPEVLARMNKRMTLDDFKRAARFLVEQDIAVRAFVLLRPPFLSEAEGVEWALRSITFAFDCGATCVSVIPTRAGNGTMERLQGEGLFAPPKLTSLEQVLSAGIELQRGRVFADTWDAARFADCQTCEAERVERLRLMNLSQTILPAVECLVCNS
ncbi:MAG: radical SAM protein [Planctomycetaceae bacterium]